ncbi:Bug family tripartite tricarboxylate transporter substrate binding protein [Allopusillimonas ginsengisoli]|uniref:Bug family tripartite tricarboxylate transporter substrate binding protein n=1 Tax=Allopusillimonas ginsengisoli TaxID=453575 RepID=UPI0010224156|nr:tripartite tricarboxylate transporter substrate binding protein [Allopusillimonas ginsengisoli]TEA77182.1 tripartite tricarboxylate transporter substrate binding protein [Allopusillimonas ginsengisoli]
MAAQSMMSRASYILLACMATFSVSSGTAVASGYPDKPVRIIVPYPPGGSTDAITRLLGNALSQKWQQPVVVENKGGASGIIGSDAAARSAPDGYTLLMNGSGPHTINVSLFNNLSYDPVRDFAPIIQTTTLPLLMVTETNSPFSTVPEFIEWSNANKGKVNYCSIGAGSPSHLAAELFQSTANMEMTHVPYKGSGPALVDTIAGVCHVLFDSALSAGPHVKSGKLKLIAIGTESRVDAWPDVPTVAESLPGFSAYSWTALVAPAGTPQDIVQKINADTAAVLADADIKEKLETQGALPGKGTSQELAAFIDTEIAKWAKVIKEGNITVN